MQYRMTDRPDAPQVASVTFLRIETPDQDSDLSYLKQGYEEVEDPAERAKYRAQDWVRLKAYSNGEWYMRGLQVEARVMVPVGQGSFATYKFTSPGVWGVESDCGPDYENEIWAQEESDLRTHLKAMGELFSKLEG